MSELNLILLGPPGAGKGTQADRLKDDFGLPYIGTGDLLRKHREEETELGVEAASYMANGDLVPDELVIRMILEEIEEKGADGFLLDGFPRSAGQADALAEALDEAGRKLTAALLIEADDETVIQRLSGRRQCQQRPPLPRRLRPAQERGRLLRHRRHAADPARRRQARHDPQAARDLPRQDRAADRLLRGARACCGASTARARRRRCTTTSARRSPRCGWRSGCDRPQVARRDRRDGRAPARSTCAR